VVTRSRLPPRPNRGSRLAGGAGPAEACRSCTSSWAGSWCGMPLRWRGAAVSPPGDVGRAG